MRIVVDLKDLISVIPKVYIVLCGVYIDALS